MKMVILVGFTNSYRARPRVGGCRLCHILLAGIKKSYGGLPGPLKKETERRSSLKHSFYKFGLVSGPNCKRDLINLCTNSTYSGVIFKNVIIHKVIYAYLWMMTKQKIMSSCLLLLWYVTWLLVSVYLVCTPNTAHHDVPSSHISTMKFEGFTCWHCKYSQSTVNLKLFASSKFWSTAYFKHYT